MLEGDCPLVCTDAIVLQCFAVHVGPAQAEFTGLDQRQLLVRIAAFATGCAPEPFGGTQQRSASCHLIIVGIRSSQCADDCKQALQAWLEGEGVTSGFSPGVLSLACIESELFGLPDAQDLPMVALYAEAGRRVAERRAAAMLASSFFGGNGNMPEGLTR